MERVHLIYSFLHYTFSWPVVVLIIAIMFRKVITEKIPSLISLRLPGGSEFFFQPVLERVDSLLVVKEKNKDQTVSRTSEKTGKDKDPEIEIPRIYSRIEAAVKERFGVSDSYNMFVSLYDNNEIDTEMFIILDSMRTLRDNIHITAHSQKITIKNIANYENNANRIIEIIKNS